MPAKPFYACHIDISYTPEEFAITFAALMSEISIADPETGKLARTPSYVAADNVFFLSPAHTKRMHELLGNMIANFERENGAILQPGASRILRAVPGMPQ